jgi:hypothetical protein
VTILRWNQKRDANEKDLVTLAKYLGCQLWKLSTPCDWLCLHRGRWFPCEIKTEDGGFTEKQKEFIKDAKESGGEVTVWRNQLDVMATLGAA